MAVASPLSNKKVLVIDDMAGMRNQLQQSLTHLGFDKLHVVSSIRDAITRIGVEKYDVILCDYFLGDSTNGQQFLEYLRTRDLIGRNTIFVMITAESSYERVVVASECAPDDYLLKPFTAEMLSTRLERLLERQDSFTKIDKAQDVHDWMRVVEECDRLLERKDKHLSNCARSRETHCFNSQATKRLLRFIRRFWHCDHFRGPCLGWQKRDPGLARRMRPSRCCVRYWKSTRNSWRLTILSDNY